jgi:hypothetical protein
MAGMRVWMVAMSSLGAVVTIAALSTPPRLPASHRPATAKTWPPLSWNTLAVGLSVPCGFAPPRNGWDAALLEIEHQAEHPFPTTV